MTNTRTLSITLALASAVLVGACKPKQPAAAPTPQPTAPARDTAAERIAREQQMQREKNAADSAAKAARDRFVADSIRDANAAAADAAMLRETLTSRIGFEFNKADLRADAKQALDAKIPILMANAGLSVRIAGHADERGSTEYNLALGTERAAMAKRYLVERGVPANRIETTSFGEEKPLCMDNNESCWSQNRRDEFEITAGGQMIMRPKS